MEAMDKKTRSELLDTYYDAGENLIDTSSG